MSSLVVFAACASAWVGAARANTGREIVTIGCVAVLASFLTGLVPGDRRVMLPLSLMLGAAALLIGGALLRYSPDPEVSARAFLTAPPVSLEVADQHRFAPRHAFAAWEQVLEEAAR